MICFPPMALAMALTMLLFVCLFVISKVKLNPDDVRCWNGAAKALWQRGDLVSAQHCYERSLEHAAEKGTYHQLSMLFVPCFWFWFA
mmetsp:Transcript_12333/g.31340  ORF Transcript_12333/g.31340 Transcript_12333/m.31340 type:complete len:87 (-) Transcript_12333:303-563(-)